MERLATEFYDFLESEKKMKVNTLMSYQRDIRAFFEHINDFSVPINLIPNYFDGYMKNLSEIGKAPSTISRNIASLRNFFKFMMSRKLICHDPTCGIKYAKIDESKNLNENLLTVSEINSIISSVTETDFKGYRDRAILETLYACGLKASELLNIRLKDLHLANGYINIVTDDKIRYAPLYKEAIIAINKYIKKGRSCLENIGNDFLFLNKDGKALSRQSLWIILKAYGEKAKINKVITPQLFRKSMAMHLMENGADVNDLQNILGHKYISLTKKYVEHFKPIIISKYNAIHPNA